MPNHNQTIIRRLPLCAGILLLAGSSAQAATVFINQHSLEASGGSLVASAQLRASSGSWDMGLSNGRNFNASNAQHANLATLFTIPTRTFTFSLQYLAGEGFVFNVRDSLTGNTTTQSWGTFSSQPAGDVVATLGGRAPLLPFDAVQIEARATTARASTTFSNLVFTSADLSTEGSFYSGTANNRSFLAENPQGVVTQDLLADVNLAGYSWQLTGDVTFLRSLVGGSANDVSLTVNVCNVASGAAIPAPEPSGVMLLAGAAGMALGRRRRQA
jgi:hypothetical protein